jgi:hypothetical protein
MHVKPLWILLVSGLIVGGAISGASAAPLHYVPQAARHGGYIVDPWMAANNNKAIELESDSSASDDSGLGNQGHHEAGHGGGHGGRR